MPDLIESKRMISHYRISGTATSIELRHLYINENVHSCVDRDLHDDLTNIALVVLKIYKPHNALWYLPSTW